MATLVRLLGPRCGVGSRVDLSGMGTRILDFLKFSRLTISGIALWTLRLANVELVNF